MRVKVRAVIARDGRVVVARERRRGLEYFTLPGGRVQPKEELEQALAREVAEETGLSVEVGALLYLAEVVAGTAVQELIAVFRAEHVGGDWDGVTLIGRDDAVAERVRPPILDTIFDDLEGGGTAIPRWLGNIHQRASSLK